MLSPLANVAGTKVPDSISVDESILLDLVESAKNWQYKASYLDILANKGIGYNILQTKWMEWIE